MAADHILAILAIAFRAADAAGIKRDTPALRLLDDEKTKILRTGIYRENVQISVLNFRDRNADVVGGGDDCARRRRSGIGASVNEIGGENKNDREACDGGGDHPAELTAPLGFEKTLFGFVCRDTFWRRRCEPFAKDQKHGCAENENEEEELVPNDGTDERHLLFARSEPAGFAEFVKARDGELRSD